MKNTHTTKIPRYVTLEVIGIRQASLQEFVEVSAENSFDSISIVVPNKDLPKVGDSITVAIEWGTDEPKDSLSDGT